MSRRLMAEAFVSRQSLPRFATTAIFFANGTGIGAWAAAIPSFRASLDLSDGTLSFVLLAAAAGAILAMPIAGLLAPRFGTGHATRIAAFVFAAALLLPSLATGIATLIMAAFAFGAANGTLDVLMNARASEVERHAGTPIMSSFHAAFSAGGFVGAGLGALLVAHGRVLPVAAFIAALLTASAWPMIGEGARDTRQALTLPGRYMLPLGILALLSMLCEGAMGDWSGVYLAAVGGASLSIAPLGFAAFSGLMLIGRLVGDEATRRLGHVRLVRLGGGLAAVGLVLAVLVPMPLVAALGFGLVGIGLANVVPAVFSTAGRAKGAPGIAAAATLGYAGFLVGPPLVGASATLASLPASFGLLALAAMVICARASLLRAREG